MANCFQLFFTATIVDDRAGAGAGAGSKMKRLHNTGPKNEDQKGETSAVDPDLDPVLLLGSGSTYLFRIFKFPNMLSKNS